MALETRLAAGALGPRSRRRDAIADLQPARPATSCSELAPGFDWAAWLDGLGAPTTALAEVVVRQPDYLAAPRRRRSTTSRSRTGRPGWPGSVAPRRAPYLQRRRSSTRTSTSTAAPSPARPSSGPAGSAASAVVERRDRRGRRQAVRRAALPARGQGSGWTSWSPTCVEAYRARHRRARLDERRDQGAGARTSSTRSRPKIGYPDEWRDYSALEIDRRRPARQRPRAATAFETDRAAGQARRAGRPRRVAHDCRRRSTPTTTRA